MVSMDLNGLLRLIFLEKYEVTFGVLIALTLLSVVLLLVRSVMEEKQEATAAGGVRGLDTKSINQAVEGALKKALSDKTLVGLGEKATTGETAATDTLELKKILSEREAKIATLMTDLEGVKAQLEGKPKEGVAAASSDEDLLLLRTKVNELQTKLSEYEIIEDDIADLSIFKEENKKLKEEVEKLRAATSTAQTQVQAAQVAVAASAEPAVDAVQAAQAAVTASAAQEPFELDTNDAVMGEFAQALTGTEKPLVKPTESGVLVSDAGDTISDPKAAIDAIMGEAGSEESNDPFGPLDTEKMLAEVQSLADTGTDSPSVLDEQLDTDRLMAEMGMAEAASSRNEASASPAVSVPASPAPPPIVKEAEPAPKTPAPVDDLLAEFSDPDFQPGRGTKGS